MTKSIVFAVLGLAAATAAAAPLDGIRWWSFIEALAGDEMKGRDTGSPEHLAAARYIATRFAKSGLVPAGTQGFLQPVKLRAWKIVEPESSLHVVRGTIARPVTLGEEAYFSRGAEPAPTIEAPLVFAGYGLTVPEMNFDDLAGLDLRGKIIVYVQGGPSNIAGPLKSHYQTPFERNRFLEKAGVVGVVVIRNPRTSDVPWSRSSQFRFQETMELSGGTDEPRDPLKLNVALNPGHAAPWFAGSGHSIEELLTLVDAGKPLPRFPLTASLRAKAKTQHRELESQNVIGIRPGSDPVLKNEYVVLSGHLDHIGVGKPIQGDSINNGALDDASGVATMLEIAASLHERKIDTRRSLLFVAVTGEEKGLLGSRYYAANPTVNSKAMVADLNIDMFLPLYPLHRVTVYGLAESDLGDVIGKTADSLDIKVQPDPVPQRNVFIRSDQYSFIRRGVPSLMVTFGFEPGSPEAAKEAEWLKTRYHAPSDDLNQPVDKEAAAQYNRLMMNLATGIADASERPRWKNDSFFRRFARP